MNATDVFVTPDGEVLQIPAEIFAATKFAKNGWPDKRHKGNAVFYKWLEENKERGTVPVINGHGAVEAEAVYAEIAANEVAQHDAWLAQLYANRVWSGQSITAPREWRIARVMEALEGQNLPTEGVVLP
jgi:hypothetical protein